MSRITSEEKAEVEQAYTIGDNVPWREQVEPPPSFLTEIDAQDPVQNISEKEDKGEDIRVKGYTQSKRYVFSMSKTSIIFLIIGLIILGGLFFTGGFMTATNHYLKKERDRIAKLKQEKKKPKEQKKPDPDFPFVESREVNVPGYYSVELGKYRVAKNAIHLARSNWRKTQVAYVVEYIDVDQIPWYSARIGDFSSRSSAETLSESLQLEDKENVIVVSKKGETRLILEPKEDEDN